MTQQDYLPFATRYKSPIQVREKTETLRFNLNIIPDVGSVLDAVTEEGDLIGKIEITGIESLKVKDVPERTFEGHENYDSVDEVITRLNEFYHDTIRPESELTLIKFELVSKP